MSLPTREGIVVIRLYILVERSTLAHDSLTPQFLLLDPFLRVEGAGGV